MSSATRWPRSDAAARNTVRSAVATRPPRPITWPTSSSATWSAITRRESPCRRSTSTCSGCATRQRAISATIASMASMASGRLRSRLGAGVRDLDQLAHRRRRLGALADPGVDLLEVDLDQRRLGLRVVPADGLDVAPIPRGARIGHHNAIDGVLLASHAGQSNLDHSPPSGRSDAKDRRSPTLAKPLHHLLHLLEL